MADVTTYNIWSTKQLIVIIAFAITTTFTLSMIWSRFLYTEQQIETLDQRSNKRYDRMNQDSQNIWSEINKLKDEQK